MPPQRRQFRPANRAESKFSCSPITLIASVLLVVWLVFIYYAWSVGLIGTQLATASAAAEIEQSSAKAEPNLRTASQLVEPDATGVVGTEPAPRAFTEEYLNEIANSDIHVIFSTDCNPYQDWQSLFVFHSAKVVGQKGPITRIASGCNEEQQSILKTLYQKLWPQYHVHFTPDFKKDEKTGRKYDFYNKPYGLKHWLKYAEPPLKDDVIVALIDPDFIFLRPLTTKMAGNDNNILSKPWVMSDIFEKVEKGKPVGQTYGLGAPWVNDNHKKFNRGKICGENSPCLEVATENLGNKYYSLGPPYIVHKDDMARIAESWTTFVPRVYEGYPYLLAEMYAYSMAAAHERLPHLRLDNFMVSNTEAGGEGWDWIDKLEDPCMEPVNGIFFPGAPLPTFLHYCQFFLAGDMAFGKRRVPHEIFTCASGLLLEPPPKLGESEYKLGKKGGKISEDKKEKLSRVQAKRNAFMICTAHRALNAAATDFKKRNCGPDANYQKTVDLADNK